jgi:hypothetical protein
VLVDEIHNLNLATSAGEDMSDHLKYFIVDGCGVITCELLDEVPLDHAAQSLRDGVA